MPRAAATALATAVVALLSLPALAGSAIPRLADGHPDFTGIWQTTSAAEYDLEPHSGRKDAPPGPGIVEGDVIPYLPQALQQRKKNFESRDKEDPRLKCWTLGVPRGIYYPEPFQILQRPRDLTLVFEFGHSVRTIHTNGTLHPKKTDNEFWLGDSRAHWEGDTLVVDVTDFTDDTWLDRAGNFHLPRCTSWSAGSSMTPTPSSTTRRLKIRRSTASPGRSACSCIGTWRRTSS